MNIIWDKTNFFNHKSRQRNSDEMSKKKKPQPLDLTTAVSDSIILILLLPGVLVADRTVLELLAAEQDLLVVLLTVCPVLLIVRAVASGTLQALHG